MAVLLYLMHILIWMKISKEDGQLVLISSLAGKAGLPPRILPFHNLYSEFDYDQLVQVLFTHIKLLLPPISQNLRGEMEVRGSLPGYVGLSSLVLTQWDVVGGRLSEGFCYSYFRGGSSFMGQIK